MLKKINARQLCLGMHIHELCGSWLSHPFWRTKFVLEDPEDIRKIIASGIKEVWINTDEGLDVEESQDGRVTAAPAEKVLSAASTCSELSKQVTLSAEVKMAAKTCNKATEAVRSMFQEIRMGKAVSPAAASEFIKEISASVHRNPGALISLARLKTADNYTYMHSVAVCALMIGLARQMAFDEDDVREAGLAGLFHDIGKAKLPMKVLNKPGKLTDEEFAIIKEHSTAGYQILEQGKDANETLLNVCLHHHEKTDGSGYPHHQRGDEISLYTKMCAVCDVYDAITSNRPYKPGWDPSESIHKMTEWSGGHFDMEVFHAFVKCIGIYPTGSLIRLSSGRLGVVLDQTEKSLLMPTVKVFYSTRTKTYVKPEIIDLSRHGSMEKIMGVEEADKWGIKNLNEYWTQPA
ncbi:MAG: HD-GYP domain-containing protein [Betaproteobacteria bacterium]|nr:HD-GYP domain-containing protein [Betaproteobacteria bacterium]